MKFLAITTILSLSAFLSACATYPQSREDQATYHASEARSAISKGDSTNAANQIDVALTRPTGDAKIKELFASYPKGRDYYLAYLEKSIVEVSSAYQAAAAFEKLSTVKSAGILPEDQVRELFTKLMKVVTDGNTTQGFRTRTS